ncbi:MAG: glycoside hydrolase family 97 protein [Prevotella sp.]|nr:glycoside hydrolase family 97 protein [Prevotella sp.]
MKIKTLISLLFLSLSFQLSAKDFTIKSPNGRLEAIVGTGEELTFQLWLDGHELMGPSLIGMRLTDGTIIGGNRRVSASKPRYINERIMAPFYRQSEFQAEANELRLKLNNNFGLLVRAYNEGAAYRFYYTGRQPITIENELGNYQFGRNRKAWLSYSTNKDKPFAMAFQNIYHETTLDTARQQIAFLPATVDCGPAKLTLLESDVSHYPGMFVRADGDALTATFAPYPKTMARYQWRSMTYVDSKEPYIAQTTGPQQYPWRIFAVTENDVDMPTNNLVYALATPNKVGSTDWIKPGKVAWDWWNDWNLKGVNFKAGINTETYKYFIDFAAKEGLEYIILDEGWYDAKSGDIMHPVETIDLPALIDYGRQHGVGIVLWSVFNVMDEQLETVCKHYADMGIKGFKVDFMDRNDQTAVEMVERLADCTARNHLLLDLHGIYTPTGLNRTYPNVLNYESVFGMEEVKWGSLRNDHPRYDVTFPYIRMMAGSVDYTPGAMRNGTKYDWVRSYSKPVSQGTRAHQTAMYVVYDSPFTMLADAPICYESEPEYTSFLSALPTVYDRTRILQGEIGQYIVSLRERNGIYYIGAMTNWEARDVTINLDFLPENVRFGASVLADGINADHNAEDYKLSKKTVSRGSKLDLHLASGGGAVVVIAPSTR